MGHTEKVNRNTEVNMSLRPSLLMRLAGSRAALPIRAFHQTHKLRAAAGGSETGEQLAARWPYNFLVPVAFFYGIHWTWNYYVKFMNTVFPRDPELVGNPQEIRFGH